MKCRKAVKYIGVKWNMKYRIKMIDFCLTDSYIEHKQRERNKPYNDYIQFPCPHDNKLTNVNNCIYCHNHLNCDIYSTMLDEELDMD